MRYREACATGDLREGTDTAILADFYMEKLQGVSVRIQRLLTKRLLHESRKAPFMRCP